MKGFDIIGDVHGHAAELESLLRKLGYAEKAGAYRHPEGRRAVLLGDFIDRGPAIRRTLEIVRSMIDAGSALAVMGNHELNAIHYTTADPLVKMPDGSPRWLRSHSETHARQFAETVRQLGSDLDEWLSWMRTLPVWMKTTDAAGVELRFVHAAWMERTMRRLWEEPTGAGEYRFHGPFEAPRLTEAGVLDFGRRKDPVTDGPSYGYKGKEKFLTGPEKPLPSGVSYFDKEGAERTSIRVKWWVDPNEDATLADMIMAGRRAVAGLGSAVSVPWWELKFKKPWAPCPVDALTFVGHYWLDADEAGPLTEKLACLDCSVAKGGALCAYRHDEGRTTLDPAAFVTVPAAD